MQLTRKKERKKKKKTKRKNKTCKYVYLLYENKSFKKSWTYSELNFVRNEKRKKERISRKERKKERLKIGEIYLK